MLEGIPYPTAEDLEKDKIYFLKKMGWYEKQLEEYIARPPKAHDLYQTEKPLWDLCSGIYKNVFGHGKR